MSMVTVRMPGAMLAERHRLGLDRRDEVWEGVHHMVPPASYEHQRLSGELFALLLPLCRSEGLSIRYEIGIIAPGVADWSDFKVPDLAIAKPEHTSDRGIEGRAELVIEIRSPADETLDKIDWYGRVGVQELLVIDRDTKTVRRWTLAGTALRETEAADEGWHSCSALPIRVRGSANDTVEIDVGTGPTAI